MNATQYEAETKVRVGWAGVLGRRIREIARNGVGNFQAGKDKRRMKLSETLNLGGKRQLMLVECDGRKYLVGAGADSVQSIVPIGTHAADGYGLGAEADGATETAVLTVGRPQ